MNFYKFLVCFGWDLSLINKTLLSELLWMLGGDDGDFSSTGVLVLFWLGIDHEDHK
jgi:hypothetical protein